MNHAHGRSPAAERGAALLLAVGALAVVAVLGAVMLANARSEIRQAERLVDRAGADSMIDVAVAVAWGDIVAGETRTFSGAGQTPTGPWSFTATPVDPRRWEILVEAGEGTDAVTGHVTVARDALLPYSLFVDDASTGPLTGRVDGRVGIRGTATFSGRSLGDVQELIGSAAACSGCSNPIIVEFGADPPPAPATLVAAPCPDTDGVITGTLTGGATYTCRDPGRLVLTGTVTVTGDVVIDIGPDVDLELDHAVLNGGGDPADLVIAQPTANGSTISVVDSSLSGILLAPQSLLTTAGLRWEGTVVARELVAAPGSELTGAWTAALESFGFAGWRIISWDTSRG